MAQLRKRHKVMEGNKKLWWETQKYTEIFN
jgi:hypothetical protein